MHNQLRITVSVLFCLAALPSRAFTLIRRGVVFSSPANQRATHEFSVPVPAFNSLHPKSVSTSSCQLHATKGSHSAKFNPRNQQKRHTAARARNQKALNILKDFKGNREINAWMKNLTAVQKYAKTDSSTVSDTHASNKESSFSKTWSLRDETGFLRLLGERGAYDSIVLYVNNFSSQNQFVYGTAIEVLARSSYNNHKEQAIILFDKMMEKQPLKSSPSVSTLVALFRCVNSPRASLSMMNKLRQIRPKIKLSVEVFNSAIYACRQSDSSTKALQQSGQTWQTALNLFRLIRTEELSPDLKSYGNLLHILGKAGQVRIAQSILTEIQNNPSNHIRPNERIWGSVLNACAASGNYIEAMKVIHAMQDAPEVQINIVHCTTYLKALARAGKDELALDVLDMMMGSSKKVILFSNETGSLEQKQRQQPQLPQIAPDLVTLNTVLGACGEADNFVAARTLLARIRSGEFLSTTGETIVPDEISYSLVLSACKDPLEARELVNEMRLSRQNGLGIVTPSHIIYARAIAVCRRAPVPDVQAARAFLENAKEDGIRPTVFMYSAAIWTAERSGDTAEAFAFLEEMKLAGCPPNTVAYNGVLSTLAKEGQCEMAFELYEEMISKNCIPKTATFQHLVASFRNSTTAQTEQLTLLERAFEISDTRIGSSVGPLVEALIKQYSSQGRYNDAKNIFQSLKGPCDVACTRAMLFACSVATPPRWHDACSVVHSSDIFDESVGPGGIDQQSLGNAIIACSKANRWEEAWNLLLLYGYKVKVPNSPSTTRGNDISVVALNALIAACGRGSRPDLAVSLLNEMLPVYGVQPDERSYRSAIIACNQAEHQKQRHAHGALDDVEELNHEDVDDYGEPLEWWECALSLLRRMKEENLSPDVQTYSSVISACEAASQWQRAVGLLQTLIESEDTDSAVKPGINLYCFNAAISACEKGGAWIEALDIYERMKIYGGSLRPNFVTLSSLVLALSKAGQKELALNKYKEGLKMKVVNPWRSTKSAVGENIKAMDLHTFSAAMASTAIRSHMESLLVAHDHRCNEDLVIIVGKGNRSVNQAVLLPTLQRLLKDEYCIDARVDESNSGRLLLNGETIRSFVEKNKRWR